MFINCIHTAIHSPNTCFSQFQRHDLIYTGYLVNKEPDRIGLGDVDNLFGFAVNQ
jgi:hypothetical protein